MKRAPGSRLSLAVFCGLLPVLGMGPGWSKLALAGEAGARASIFHGMFDEPYRSRLKNIAMGPGRLSLGGGVRFRYEYQNHYNRKQYGAATHDGFLLSRFRLHFDYRLRNGLRAFLELQDARVYGSDFGIHDFHKHSPDQNPTEVHQAYISWREIGGGPFGFKIGRQRIKYGDGRIWGPGEWGNTGRYTWDAIKLLYDTEPLSLDLIWGRRVMPESDYWDVDDRHYDFNAYGAYAQIKNLPAKLDLFYVLKKGHTRRTCGPKIVQRERRNTVGFQVSGKMGERIDYRGTGAWQFGNWGREDIEAFGADATLGYTFDALWTPRIGVEFNYASGDRHPDDDTHGAFDSVFGSRDRLYGRMNLVGWSNLQDYVLSFSVKPVSGLMLRLDHHVFRLAQPKDCWYYSPSKGLRRDSDGEAGRHLGQETDLIADCMLALRLHLLLIGGVFFPGEYIRTTGEHRRAQWGCVQIEYKF